MASELLAAAAAPAKLPSSQSTTTITITTTAVNGATTTTTTTVAAANGTTTTTCTTTTVANGTTTTTSTTTTVANGTTTAAAANGTVTTTTAAAATATTISSLSEDDLREIFLRLPDLPALVRAALTCRSWLRAVRSSPSFRRLFRALHPGHLIGLFFELNGATPFFVPMRRPDWDITAALRRGDFFLTSLPQSSFGWSVTDCRDGWILLWNKHDLPSLGALAALNPMTWAVDIIPFPGDITAGRRRDFCFLGFYLLSSEENPSSSFRVACVCADRRRVRAAIFSSETRKWAIRPWVHIGGNNNLKFMAGAVVDGSVFWPCSDEGRMMMITTATMDISFVNLPSQVLVDGCNFSAGETKDGQLCIVYESDFILHVWIRGVDSNGIEIWVQQNILSLGEEVDRTTRGVFRDLQGFIHIAQLRSGYVYLSMTFMTPAGTQLCCFFSLSLETMKLELLVEGTFNCCAHPYVMAWPPSLVGDDVSIGHDPQGSH